MQTWRIVAFNDVTLFGRITDGTRVLDFHSTLFHVHACTGFRWPRVGEEVEVVFNNSGVLLSIHALT